MIGKTDFDFVTDKSRPGNHNYLGGNFFRLTISRAPTLSYFTQQVSLPSISLMGLEQPTTLSNTIKIPGNSYQFNPLVITYLMDEEMRCWKELYDWITSIANYTSDKNTLQYKDTTSNIILHITNSSYKEKFQITFINAYPESIGDIPFSIQATDTIPLSGKVSFKYSYYEFKALT